MLLDSQGKAVPDALSTLVRIYYANVMMICTKAESKMSEKLNGQRGDRTQDLRVISTTL
jgi:ABC-type phosphate transport system auxiliary subunit